MKLNKHDAQTEMEMNMTPMIDVVFLLIIFFMIITDLSQQELEELQLPVAQECNPDKPPPGEWRPILNINIAGQIIRTRDVLYDPEDPEQADFLQLQQELVNMARRMNPKFDETLQVELPDDALLIRADEHTPFKYVQKVMEVCAHPDIKIWKLQLAAKEPADAAAAAASN